MNVSDQGSGLRQLTSGPHMFVLGRASIISNMRTEYSMQELMTIINACSPELYLLKGAGVSYWYKPAFPGKWEELQAFPNVQSHPSTVS